MSAALSPRARQGILGVLELPIAFGVFRTAYAASYWLGCQLHACHDLESIGVAIYALPIGVVVGIAFWVVALRMGSRWRGRLVFDAGGLLLGIAGYLLRP